MPDAIAAANQSNNVQLLEHVSSIDMIALYLSLSFTVQNPPHPMLVCCDQKR
jgi:hypothetical protein